MAEKTKFTPEEKVLLAIFGKSEDTIPATTKSKLDPEKKLRLKAKLGEIFATLNEREKKVLELRFGLGDGYFQTLEKVGEQFRVTRERIRQIETKALRKMRHPKRIQQLQESLKEGKTE